MTTLGKYELHEQLGKGGFGTVYRATDPALEREVALKLLHPELMIDNEFTKRFQREAKTLARIDHPHIVSVFDQGEEDGRVYIVMRYLPGGNLKDRINNSKKLPRSEVQRIFNQICSGLMKAHSKGLIHRDLKPENILFSADDEAVITDFGLVKIQSEGTPFSVEGIIGTPNYIAPEIWRGKSATVQSDIYALGCILYEMLTGNVLFAGDSLAQVMTKHILEGPRMDETLPEPVRNVLYKALSSDAGERYQTVIEFENDFNKLFEKKKKKYDLLNRLKEFFCAQRKAILIWSLGLVGLLVMVGVVILLVNLLEEKPKANRYSNLVTTPDRLFYSADIRGEKVIYYLSENKTPKVVTREGVTFSNWDPNRAPSGRLYFVSNRNNRADIYLLDSDGITVRVTNSTKYANNWDPMPDKDGRLYFVTDRNGFSEIMVMDKEGVVKPVIHSHGKYNNWDPFIADNGNLYFTSDRTGKAEIYVLKLKNAGKTTRITYTPGSFSSWDPTLSNKGVLYFTSDRAAGVTSIYVIDIEGVTKRMLNEGETWNPIPDDVGGLYFTSNRFGKESIYYIENGEVQIIANTPGNTEDRTAEPKGW
ncbi:MAG TPA: protein kinase [Anaerolineaceae bacterium]|nr:protein kinase [Anaerolineaceae bacterium]